MGFDDRQFTRKDLTAHKQLAREAYGEKADHYLRVADLAWEFTKDREITLACLYHGMPYFKKKRGVPPEQMRNIGDMLLMLRKYEPESYRLLARYNSFAREDESHELSDAQIQRMLHDRQSRRISIMRIIDRIDTVEKKQIHEDPAKDHLYRKNIATKIMEKYGPIAERLNIHGLQTRLLDSGFRVLFPDLSLAIENEQNALTNGGLLAERKTIEVKEALQKSGIDPRVLSKIKFQSRTKGIFSTFLKAHRDSFEYANGTIRTIGSKKPLSWFGPTRSVEQMSIKNTLELIQRKVKDLFAIRVIVPTGKHEGKPLIYTVEGALKKYVPNLKTKFNYEINPKPSGYQAIHMGSRKKEGFVEPVEIQIRDEKSHREAETGKMMHHLYKEDREDKIPRGKIDEDDRTLAWLGDAMNYMSRGEISSKSSLDAYFALRAREHQPTNYLPYRGKFHKLPANWTGLRVIRHFHPGQSSVIGNIRGLEIIDPIKNPDKQVSVSLDKPLPSGVLIYPLFGKAAAPSAAASTYRIFINGHPVELRSKMNLIDALHIAAKQQQLKLKFRNVTRVEQEVNKGSRMFAKRISLGTSVSPNADYRVSTGHTPVLGVKHAKHALLKTTIIALGGK